MHYEVSIKSDKTMKDGLIKNVTEKYLVEAVSFAEAETRAAEYITDYVSGEYDICAIRRLKVSELFYSSDSAADRWYSAKLSFITVDEKKGKERKRKSPSLSWFLPRTLTMLVLPFRKE